VIGVLDRVAGAMVFWGPILPCLVVAGVFLWWSLGRARGLDAVSSLGWVPWLGPVLRDARAANFASWLSLLLEHGVPLPEGLELAGRAAGDRNLESAARAWATATRRGEPLGSAGGGGKLKGCDDRPMLRWLLSGAITGNRLAPALAQAARTYRARAMRMAEALAATLPSLLLLLIGGMTALLYTLVLVVPWTNLLRALSGESV
jgi:type II secretory pathway component PulF